MQKYTAAHFTNLINKPSSTISKRKRLKSIWLSVPEFLVFLIPILDKCLCLEVHCCTFGISDDFFCIIASSYSLVISLNPLVFVLYRSRYLEILPKCFIGESILSVDGTYCMRFELNKCDMFDKFHLIDHYFWLFFWRKFVYIFCSSLFCLIYLHVLYLSEYL